MALSIVQLRSDNIGSLLHMSSASSRLFGIEYFVVCRTWILVSSGALCLQSSRSPILTFLVIPVDGVVLVHRKTAYWRNEAKPDPGV